MSKASDFKLKQVADSPATASEILNILSVADFKAEHRIEHSAEDDKIEDCIKEAYYRLDGRGLLNRAILTQTWTGYLDEFENSMELPLPVLQSVSSVRYRDSDGDWQTLATTIYGVIATEFFGRIYLKLDQVWPTLYEEPNSVEITFVCGWGTGSDVLTKAYNIRKILKLLGGHFYFNPTPTFVELRLVEVPRKVWYGLEYLLGQYRIPNDPS